MDENPETPDAGAVGPGPGGRDPHQQRRVDQAADALEAGDLERAVALAGEAVDGDPGDLEACLLAGVALLELGRYRDAHAAFARAAELAPDDPEVVTYQGATHFILGDEDAAARLLRRAVADLEAPAEAYYWLSMVVERGGRYGESDALLARAVEIDPERYHAPYRIGRSRLEAELEALLHDLPEPVAEAVRAVPIVIEDLPSREVLEGHEDSLAPDILGLFVGESLAEGSVFETPLEPNAVYLFQRNLERVAADREQLLAEVRITLIHEIGHYLGLDEGDLHDRGLD